MGIVTDYLRKAIEKQINEHQMVVWYDPEKQYAEIAETLSLPDTTVARYSDSFFALRHELDPLLELPEKPRLLVYVPLDPAQTHHALAEIEVSAVTMKPGQQPRDLNTRLSVIARNALKGVMSEEAFGAVEKQIEDGKLSLSDLDKLAEGGRGIGTVILIFGTGNAPDVALAFLSNSNRDAEIVNRDALTELGTLLEPEFGIEPPKHETIPEYRRRLVRHILVNDLIAALGGTVPQRLGSLKLASKPTQRESCATLAQTWRLRRDLHESYATSASQVERDLDLSQIELTLDTLQNAETFLWAERYAQRQVVTGLLKKADASLVKLATDRGSSFWPGYEPDVQAEWALIAAAGQVLIEAVRVEKVLGTIPADPKALVKAYAEGDQPLCLLDTHYRHMEHRFHTFDFGQDHTELERLITAARSRYMQVGSTLAEKFIRQYAKSKFQIKAVPKQREIFEDYVKPRLHDGKAAYVLVDALRFEMARELVETLRSEFDIDISPAIGTVPTITEVGMAALMPGAGSMTVAASHNGKLIPQIGDSLLKGRKERIKHLESQAGVKVFDVKLEDLLPTPKNKTKEAMKTADLILVTSQEIDALCEGDNIHLAQQTMNQLLHELGRIFRILKTAGVRNIVLAADHGYLFGEEVGDDMKIDAPGGTTFDLDRRAWVGQGGAENPAYLRARLADFGLGGDYEIATPWNFACFRSPGGTRAYFHGGLSPQELIIPVVTLVPKGVKAAAAGSVSLTLTHSKPRISTRLFSVLIEGQSNMLFDWTPPKVRVEIRSGAETISIPATATYGLEEATGNVQLERTEGDPPLIKPNSITVMITKDPIPKLVTIHLLDVASGMEVVKSIAIETAIAI